MGTHSASRSAEEHTPFEPAEAEPEEFPIHDEPDDEGALPPLSVDGHGIANLSADACRARVRELHIPVTEARHASVDVGMRPAGPIGDVTIEFVGRNRVHQIMDCRLILAIHAWSPVLRAVGVERLRHLSALRPGAITRSTGRASGHSRGLAFDVRHIDFEDGRSVDVLTDWIWRQRGAPPCDPPPEPEPPDSALMRALVCQAIEAQLFQVVVTPHNDDAHANHLHLEMVPGVDWVWSG